VKRQIKLGDPGSETAGGLSKKKEKKIEEKGV